MVRPRIIVNPTAGRGRGASARDEIEKAFTQAEQPLDLMVTTKPADATRWAREAAEDGVPYIAGAGGDGTAHEVVNGLAQWVEAGGNPERLPALGMIPCGTGNDFAWGYKLPLDISLACQRLFASNTRSLDVGLLKSDTEPPRYFGHGVGVGFDAVVNIESRKIRFVRGGAAFLPAVFATMAFYYRAPRVVIRYDGETFEDNLMMISVMNGERFGAMFHMTPGSRNDDRLLSLCFVRKMSRPAMVPMVARFVRGTHPGHSKVKLATASSITVEADEPMPAHVEGEIYSMGSRRYEFSIVPWQIQMIC